MPSNLRMLSEMSTEPTGAPVAGPPELRLARSVGRAAVPVGAAASSRHRRWRCRKSGHLADWLLLRRRPRRLPLAGRCRLPAPLKCELDVREAFGDKGLCLGDEAL